MTVEQDHIVSFDQVSKVFGKKVALDGIDLRVPKGRTLGIIGPNGSGKTTLINLFLSLLSPSAGQITLSIDPAKVSAALEGLNLYPRWTALKNLELVCMLKGVNTDQVEHALKKVDLFEDKDRRVKTFSKGMRQRLNVAATLLASGDECIIYDEPFEGLDPEGFIMFRNLIGELYSAGKTVIICSHLLSEVESMVDDIVIMGKGKIHTIAPLSQLVNDHGTLERAYFHYKESR